MEQRKSQNEILQQLVSDGHLTSERADEIAQAPTLAFSVRELVSYLAAILITIGVADRVVFMDGGVIIEQGPPSQVISAPVEERTRAFLSSVLNH